MGAGAVRHAERGGHTERLRTVREATYSDFDGFGLALSLHTVCAMALGPRRTATSYDDILRATVPNPDSSFRPSREEEEMSRHRFGAPTEHRPHIASREELDLLRRVRVALAADNTIELSDVEVDVDGSQIILLGTVPGPATRVRIEDIVASVHGVELVDNQLGIRRHG